MVQLKLLTLVYENFFLYDFDNMITETFVMELNLNFSTYSLISFSGEKKVNNQSNIITPDNKLKFYTRKGHLQKEFIL